MKYCPTSTKNHDLAKKHGTCSMLEMIQKEHGNSKKFTNEPVIDLDKVEDSYRRSHKLHTMDGTVALDNRSMLLIEFKLDVKNPNNLKNYRLPEKVKNSKAQINGTNISKAHNENVFVLNKNQCSEAKNVINKIFGLKPKPALVLTPDELYDKFFA